MKRIPWIRRGLALAACFALGTGAVSGQEPGEYGNRRAMIWGGDSPEAILEAYRSAMQPQPARLIRPVAQYPTRAPQAAAGQMLPVNLRGAHYRAPAHVTRLPEPMPNGWSRAAAGEIVQVQHTTYTDPRSTSTAASSKLKSTTSSTTGAAGKKSSWKRGGRFF